MRSRDLNSDHRITAAYYTKKAEEFGATPFGVDWTCVATQEMRFVQLLRLCDFRASFALNDVGCGYGALLDFLDRAHGDCAVGYLGVDISDAMVRLACERFAGRQCARFITGHESPRIADYSVASGIFNVRLNQPLDAWESTIAATLDQMAITSRRGFAVNFIAAPPAGKPVQPGLYATTPERWAHYCGQHGAADIELVQGYGLSEFTLLVRPRSVPTMSDIRV